MHCPPGTVRRPIDTGWFAGFEQSETAGRRRLPGARRGRFWGATFDPSGLYRFNAVQRLLDRAGIEVESIHTHVTDLQRRFLGSVAGQGLDLGELLPPRGRPASGATSSPTGPDGLRCGGDCWPSVE